MKLHISQSTDVGKVRTNNQDACSVDILDPRENAALLMVADGMGGYEGGEVASRVAVDTIRARVVALAPDWAEKGMLAEGLLESINAANRAIIQEQDKNPRLLNMGTTVTAALIWGDRIFLGHCGDSKAFLIGKRTAKQVSTDHTVVSEMVQSGHITADEAAIHPRRHVLTRALGAADGLLIEQQSLTWQTSDVLILATDGLSDLVSLAEVKERTRAAEKDQLAAELVALANERGGHDNITVLVARWEG